MIKLDRLLDTIDDPEKDYYILCLDLLQSKGVKVNSYENRDGIKPGKGLAGELLKTSFIHGFMDIRKIIYQEDILLFFDDDSIEVSQINRFTYLIKLLAKGGKRLQSERRSVLDTNEYIKKIINDFIDSVKSNSILSLTKNDYLVNSFYKKLCTDEEIEFLEALAADKNFRTVTDEVDAKYTKIHARAVKNLEKIKKEIGTGDTKFFKMIEYYQYFGQKSFEKLKEIEKEDRINKFYSFIENELILI